MKRVLEKIHQNSNENVEGKLSELSSVAMSKSNVGGNRNSINFDFTFDSSGRYVYSTNQRGFGKKVNFTGKIISPEDGIYSVSIESSDGGGGKWSDVKSNQEVSCIISTSFWHETTVTVKIDSNKPNSDGHAIIEYFV